ncbi:hypothetical protein CVT26_004791 [Gymnopilus dilepis]|uniref:Hypervirulence associated protein TUDOR domain-containing protein n=1 Tax=Gymnopilus dilepis TaxID=231916 RepID=A0A409XZH8_9AGAR|nr:hypothetical protein CVT26_004791 [Gymnopilus dilepis]
MDVVLAYNLPPMLTGSVKVIDPSHPKYGQIGTIPKRKASKRDRHGNILYQVNFGENGEAYLYHAQLEPVGN